MLKIFISFMLGPFGLKILDFYIRNSAILNSIVFIYGIFLTLAHVNYTRITQEWFNKLKNENEKPSKRNLEINWEKAISENSKFPYIAGGTSLAPKRTSQENLKFFLDRDKNWQKIVS